MLSKVETLLNFITRNLIVDENWFDNCLLVNIQSKDWPECKAKLVADEYTRIRSEKSHHFAAVQVSGYYDELATDDSLPTDPQLLGAYYEITLKEFKAMVLSNAIKANPQEAERYIQEFFSSTISSDELSHFGPNLEKYYLESIRLSEAGEASRSIRGWPLLSDKIGGFNPGRVGIMMAATGFGKSTLAVNFANCAAKTMSVAYFNMEMMEQDFAEKLMMAAAGIDFKTLKRDPKSVANKIANIYVDSMQQKLFFSRGKALSVEQIFAIARRQKTGVGLDLCIVDYDQKLVLNVSKEQPEWKALQIAVERFEVLAKELNIYVLILAQESDGGDVSGSKRSKFPASTVMRFHKTDDDKFIIEAVKNRFGRRGAAIEVDYEPEKSFVSEKCEAEFTTGSRPRSSKVMG